MAQMTVTSTGATLAANNHLIQNLGPGTLYVGTPGVTDASGLRVNAGQAISMTAVTTIGLIASGGDCDVRYQAGSSGIHSITTP